MSRRGPARSQSRALIVAIIASLAVVAILTGSGCSKRDAGSEQSAKVALSIPSDPPALPVSLATTLTLPWDSRGGVAVDPAGFSGLETSFVGKRGLYVVDHPGNPPGARVRWYQDGRLKGTYQAPAGSFSFAAHGDGFSYVIGKGASNSGSAVIVDGTGRDVATYTIPLEVNSGGLRQVGDTLYSIAWAGSYDDKTVVTLGHDVLVPVAINNRQASRAEAIAGQLDAWWAGPGGKRIEHKTRLAYLKDPENYIVSSKTAIRIPNDAFLLGVDSELRTWVALPPRALATRGAAGWPTVSDETALVVAFDEAGAVQGVMPIHAPTGVAYSGIPLNRRLSFDGRFLSLQDMSADGVTVYAFKVKP